MSFKINPLEFMKVPFGGDNDDSVDDSDSGSSGQQSNSQGNQQNSQSSNATGTQGNSGSKTSNDDDSDDPYKDYSAKELKRLASDLNKRAKDAEKERDSLKTAQTQAERDKMDKEQRLEVEGQEKDATIETLRAANARLAVENAILNSNEYSWQDVGDVTGQLDFDEITIDDKGKVDGLTQQLKKIAKDKPYLLKGNKNNQQQNNSNSGGPTGLQPGQGGANAGGNATPDAKSLAEKYPALASRIRELTVLQRI